MRDKLRLLRAELIRPPAFNPKQTYTKCVCNALWVWKQMQFYLSILELLIKCADRFTDCSTCSLSA